MGVLLICSSSLFIVYLDSTILNVALPTLQKDLHASLSGLQWVADAYLLVVASLLMLTGSTADRLGRHAAVPARAGRASASARCCAHSRRLPGRSSRCACSRASAGRCSLRSRCRSSATPSRPRSVPRRLASVSGLRWPPPSGPIVGGVLVATVGWRSIFWLNVPICAVLIAATLHRAGVQSAQAPQDRRSRPDPDDRAARLAHLRGDPGPGFRLDLTGGPRPVQRRRGRSRRLRPGRAPSHRAPARTAVLPLPPVHRRDRDRGRRVHRAGRLPVRHHPLPAAGPRFPRRCGPDCRCCRHAGDGGPWPRRPSAHRPPRGRVSRWSRPAC